MEIFAPTAREKELIQWVITTVRGMVQNTPIRHQEETMGAAPDTYIARLRTASTINAMTREEPEGSGTQGGVTVPGSQDSPRSSRCDLYRILGSPGGSGTAGDPEFVKVLEDVEVYNVAPDVVVDDWFVVTRTKFGEWIRVSTTSDRWEFARILQDVDDGIQPEGVWAELCKGPAQSNISTGEVVQIDYVKGGPLTTSTIITVSWKWGGTYAIPWECPS